MRQLFAVATVLIVAGCSGGGCSSGCACAGLTPLPDGFKAANRIENAGSVQLTQSGLGFLAQNLGPLATNLLKGMGQGGVINFNVPNTSGSVAGIIDYNVCPNGPDPSANPPVCVAEINVGAAKLNFATAAKYDLKVSGPLPIRLRNLPIDFKYLGFINDSAQGVLDGDGTCPGEAEAYADIDLDVDIEIAVDQNMNHSRYGYTKLKVTLGVDQNQIKNSLHFCGGSFSAGLINALKGVAFGQLIGPLLDTLQSQIDQQLCLQANPNANPTCPTGTNDVNGICRYGSDDKAECASIILGTDGHMDLGGLLASISPGTTGGLDFLFAAGGPGKRDDNSGFSWGDLNPISGGATLGMYGGAEPNPLSKCVKMSDLALPTGIPIPDELLDKPLTDWPMGVDGPHVGIALSERFANYALNGMYNSGLLCIGISTENVALLNSGTLSLLASSSKQLGLQGDAQQVAIVIRPSSPPTITFGNGTDLDKDPLLRVKLNQASFDFYIFSLDRYIRFMTATFDLDVPVNLTVTPDGLTPVLKKLGVTNGKVTNNSLLRENPDTIAASLSDLIASQVGQLAGGGLKPINLNSSLASLGLQLIIPDTVEGKGSPGLRKLSKGADNYLGIFAALAPAMAPKILPPGGTQVQVIKKTVDRDGLKLVTIRPDNAPKASLYLGSSLDDGSRAVEYQYRVDTGFWHPFSRERFLDVQDGYLRVQGRHLVQVRSRVVGDPMSLDPNPAEVEVVIDAEPPAIKVGAVDEATHSVSLSVKDMVSGDRSLVRTRLDGGVWSDWKLASALTRLDVGEAADLEIEAKDEEGNVGTAQQALVRGRAAAAASGCGCTVAGADDGPRGAIWLVGMAIAGIGARLLKRDRRASRSVPAPVPVPESPLSSPPRTLGARSFLVPIAALALSTAWAGCNCGVETTPTGSSTGSGPTPPALDPGLIGAYTSVAVSGSTIWVSGYAEANWDDGNQFGDLVVGKWNGKNVDWVAVDGVPTDPKPDPKTVDVKGFRGGQTEAGDDVGLWTSMALDSAGNPAVAYYDRTNKQLKFAKFDGTAWAISVVDGKPGADTGRYAKLLSLNGGFVIAYMTVAAGGDKGALVSGVRVATATNEKPGATDWAFEDAVVDKNTPCRATFCDSSSACIASTKACTVKLDDSKCNPACASGNACVADAMGAGSCQAIIDASKIDSYPETGADYVSISPDPKGTIGIAYYDRVHGNLNVASRAGGAWKTMLVDGDDGMGNDTGDVGIGASLFIDPSNDWHIAYVDGLSEALKYVKLTGGTKVNAPEVIDDGLGVAGTPFDDGQHLVGDDAHLVVTSSGEVRVSFQDATAGTLHYAVGAPGTDKHTWTVQALAQDHFAGAFSNIVETDGKLQLVNWWRAGGAKVQGDVAIVSP